jgi:hypothetical protein
MKSPWAYNRRAIKCGFRTAAGERCLRVPVRATFSGLDRELYQHEVQAVIIARSPAEAAAYWLDFWSARVAHPVEVEAVGVKGGITYRCRGWEGVIGHKLLYADAPTCKQLDFGWPPAALARPARKARPRSGASWFYKQILP